MSPEREHVTAQAMGVGAIVFTGIFASGIRLDEPLSVLPPLLMYVYLQAIFRLSLRRAKRQRRKRTFAFIA